MAALFSTAIAAFCAANATGQYNEACNKAVDAGTRQAGWRQQADNVEDRTISYVNKQVESYTPKPMQDLVGAAGFLYKTAQTKKLNFRLPNLGMASSISNEITPTSYTINITWRFK